MAAELGADGMLPASAKWRQSESPATVSPAFAFTVDATSTGKSPKRPTGDKSSARPTPKSIINASAMTVALCDGQRFQQLRVDISAATATVVDEAFLAIPAACMFKA
eukprot:CAMPEP_0174877340 /NCGR_PEP_ID=MMETSP1114-20130205/81710_1 /TAXON_ID=312471 /ORGANISM="Neobodo designis, Strain CCAP 1951/1" /LENGTH=106 /DNA_ID=CAMNT_0016112719 /DNA_START=217 /DNA_END=533 /DNA_ORIENTATION=+